MDLVKAKILGSNYLGLFGITSDSLCLLPNAVDDKTAKVAETALGVKVVKTTIYDSSLIAVFAKINNKCLYLPKYASAREVEALEKEIKVKIINTDNALGNMLELNDTCAIVSKTLPQKVALDIESTGLKVTQMNIGKTDAVGSSIVITNRGFLITPNATREEYDAVEKALGIRGGSATANMGDALVRNSIIANKKGALVGSETSGFELNRIEEALEG
ncbi:MAG: translation initiation factor IF-6 [archaeon]